MAVKQYTSETNQCSDTLKYNITKILEYIEGIDLDVELEINQTEVCKQIVDLLGHVEIPRDPKSVIGVKDSIKKVELFLEKLKEKYPKRDFVEICLKELYKIIMTVENPSPAAGIILHMFDLNLIPKATQWFLNNSDHTSDEDIKRGVRTLVKWIVYSHFVNNLQLWIIGILTALREQQKYDLLLEIAEANIDFLQNVSAIPVLYKDCISVVILILTSVQHTPKILHRFIKNFSAGYCAANRKNNIDITPLEETLLALMSHFPARRPETALEYNRVRELIQTSTDNKDILDVPPWHDETKCKRRNTNAKVGLVNLGNTCYMNSVLQALMMTKQFTRDLLLTETRSPLFLNMQRLMALLLHSDRPQLSPNSVHQTARPAGFHAGHEQDSSEFLEHLLDQLHEQEKPRASQNLDATPPKRRLIHAADLPSDPIDESCPMDIDEDHIETDGARSLLATSDIRMAPPTTLIQRSFGGNISITYKCLNCQTESKQFDSFRDLHLSFPDDADDTNANHSVQELLDFYCSTEKLEADNKYFCDQCKALCIGERFINIVTAPRNLILTLKHFKYDQKYNMRAKLMNKVRHEDVISVKVFPSSDYKEDVIMNYRLYAAVVHSGVSMETGHYFTYGSDGTGCYKFDDSYVSKATIADIHNLQPPHTPYILFYQMVPNPDHVSPKSSTSTSSTSSAAIARNSSSSAVADLTTITLCEYPALEDLPPQLREYVNRDNISYSEEMRSQSSNSVSSSVWTRNRKNNFYGPPDDDNNDDQPPSSCGTNFTPSFNRYIS